MTVPLATYTGWALRAGAQANDGCEGSGQFIPFAEDQGRSHGVRRSAAVDRGALSVVLGVLLRGGGAINDFVAHRWMLPEDANAALNRMLQAGYSTGAIKLDSKFAFMKDGFVPVDNDGQPLGSAHLQELLQMHTN